MRRLLEIQTMIEGLYINWKLIV